VYTDLIHRIVVTLGFIVAVICFSCNMFWGRDLLYSAFVSLCVFFAVSTVLLMTLQGVAQVLLKHLSEKKKMQAMVENEQQEQESKKLPG